MADVQFRLFNFPDDLPALVNLKNDYFKTYQIERVTDEEKQRQLLSYPAHKPNHDNYVATLNNELIGHIWVWQQTEARSVFDLHVHPNWTRQGIGTELVKWAIERSRQQGSQHLDSQVNVEHSIDIHFLHKQGLRPLGTYLSMELPVTVSLPEYQWSDNYYVKTYAEVDDISLYTQAMNGSYNDLWGHMVNVSEAFIAQSLTYYQPESIFLLFDAKDAIVGMGRILCDVENAKYVVDAPGIFPQHRSASLYRAILLHSLHVLRNQAKQPTNITMDSWGDFDYTVDLFWSLGFIVNKHILGFRYYL